MKNEELQKEIYTCEKCKALGFERNISNGMIPLFGEGNPNNPIWIIGLNPKEEENGLMAPESANEFESYIETELNYFRSSVHQYFKDFKHVFGANWSEVFKEYVYHTDIVKCGSKSFRKNQRKAIATCSEYISKQLAVYSPKIIICNGSPVSDWFKKNYPNELKEGNGTSFFIKNEKGGLYVLLSGFIGRIDNYARLRLGKELKEQLDYFNLKI